MGDFSWWLLIIGVVGGGLLTWLVLADSQRLEREIGEEELAAEAAWIERTLRTPLLDARVAEDVLRAHRRYLGFPPPDVLVSPEELPELADHRVVAEPPADLVADVPGALSANNPASDDDPTADSATRDPGTIR